MEILLPLAGYEGIYPEMTYVVGTQVTNCRRLRRDRTRQGASSRANIPCDRRRLQGYICPERKYRSLTGCPNRRWIRRLGALRRVNNLGSAIL